MEYNIWKRKLLFCRLWDCQEGCIKRREQVMTPLIQNPGKFKWNLCMPCFIFPDRCMQSFEQFQVNFLTSPGAFVVEEDAVHSKEIVGLSEVHHNPVGIQFCCPYKHNFKILQLSALLRQLRQTHIHTALAHKVKSANQQWSALEFDSFPMCHILYEKNIQPNKQQLNRKMFLFCSASELARKH